MAGEASLVFTLRRIGETRDYLSEEIKQRFHEWKVWKDT